MQDKSLNCCTTSLTSHIASLSKYLLMGCRLSWSFVNNNDTNIGGIVLISFQISIFTYLTQMPGDSVAGKKNGTKGPPSLFKDSIQFPIRLCQFRYPTIVHKSLGCYILCFLYPQKHISNLFYSSHRCDALSHCGIVSS